MDAYAENLRASLQSKSPEQRVKEVLAGLDDMYEAIRHVELVKGYYLARQYQQVLLSGQTPNLFDRIGHARSATESQMFVHDLDPVLEKFEAAKSKISAALES